MVTLSCSVIQYVQHIPSLHAYICAIILTIPAPHSSLDLSQLSLLSVYAQYVFSVWSVWLVLAAKDSAKLTGCNPSAGD